MNDIGDVMEAVSIGLAVSNFLVNTSRVLKAIELCKEGLFVLDNEAVMIGHQLTILYEEIYFTLLKASCIIRDYTNAIRNGRKLLHIYRKCGERTEECAVTIKLATLYIRQSRYIEAKELCEKALPICMEIGHRNFEAYCYGNLGTVYESSGEYDKAKKYHKKSLLIKKEIGDRKGEALSCGHIGTVLECVGEYKKAREYHLKALAITKDLCERKGEASCCGNLGNVCQALGEYTQAREYLKKAFVIAKEIGDKSGEACFSGNLGNVFQSLGDYVKAKEHLKIAVQISKEIRDRGGEATFSGNLGTVLQSTGEYEKAKEYHEKALNIQIEICDRKGEATSYGNIATAFQSLGECEKAKKYLEKALAIGKEIGDRKGEATSYGNLGAVFHKSLGDYAKAKDCLKESMVIRKQIGDRQGEQVVRENFGGVFGALSDYVTAKEYFEEALAISKEIGDRKGEASSYGSLGTVFASVGEYEKGLEYLRKALKFTKEIGDRQGEAAFNANIGTLFVSLGKYAKAMEHLEEALAIRKEIGDRKGEETDYENLGKVFKSLGDFVKAKEYFEKALVISKEIGLRRGEAYSFGNLGTVHKSLGKYGKAKECQKKALAISEEIGDVKRQFLSLYQLASVNLLEDKIHEAISCLLSSTQKGEDLRSLLRDNDQFKILFSDKYSYPYRELSVLFCSAGSPNEALSVSELGRARALADLMSAQYSVNNEISANPQVLNPIGIERIMHKEHNCTCLFLSYSYQDIFSWILKASGVAHWRKDRVTVNGTVSTGHEGLNALDAFFTSEIFRRFGILPDEHCEDRSLNGFKKKPKSSKPLQEDNPKALHLRRDDTDKEGPKLNLSQCYNLMIAPVADIIEGPEIIIVPERSLYNVPFAALPDESGKYLSETLRIRVVPSLTTLKLIQNSPADYHSQTGALVVGNPDVGRVRYKGRLKNILPLPCAAREAIMVGEKLGVKPLIGQEATKQAVLQAINSVSLIHFAAHGDAERGEIALAPLRSLNKIPPEEDYLLTMSDISKVHLRAKLVVLSCCHSGRGQIRAEGVVGIARAFLGSGARSVLVSLWALEDSATEQFMNRFYEHLVVGESASECLHEAMKWMRCNGYPDVRQWAPFMLIGDNVAFDFGK